jgi:copper(I)-binding protein
MNTTMSRRGFAGFATAAAIALTGSRFAFAHGDKDNGTPEADATPHAMHGSGTGAVWFTITNGGETDDRLVSAASDAAATVEIHEMAMSNGTMTMSPLPDGLPVPAGETVVLEPGGYHIMLIGLTRDLKAGDSLDLVLTFETAGEITVEVPIFATKDAAEDAELETVQHGDLELSGFWSRQAPALMGDATPVASPTH